MAPLKLRVYYYYDPDSKNWGFRVPALRVIGGGCETREEAERHSLQAVRLALDDEGDPEAAKGAVAEYIELTPVFSRSE